MPSLTRLIFSFLLPLILLVNAVCADEIPLEDLLVPEMPAAGLPDSGHQLSQDIQSETQDIDALLGPKEIFPFLPDNHRDSGTGKFNAF